MNEQLKGEAKRKNNKSVEKKSNLLAQKVSSFDSYVVLNNLPQGRTIVSLIRNGSGTVSLKVFNGYVDPVKNSSVCSF